MSSLSPGAGYLGIDAGGSKTAWAWLDACGIRRQGETAGIQVAQLGVEAAANAIVDLLQDVAVKASESKPAAVVAGLAGAGDPGVRAALIARVAERCGVPLQVVGDVEVAAAAALAHGPGVAVWSGTGSFAVARDAAGRLHRVGGRGWLLGDEGSAFDIVRRAASAALHAFDGLGPATALGAAFERSFGVALARLSPRMAADPPGETAKRLALVVQVARTGDAVATAVLARAGQQLAQLVQAAAARAQLELASAIVYFGGGTLEHVSELRVALASALRQAGHPGELCAPASNAAVGAATLAQAVHEQRLPLSNWVSHA